VDKEYLWTSGMVSDCKEKFTWCSVDKKVEDSLEQNDIREKCLAVELNSGGLKSFRCSKEMLFACEVEYI